MGYSSSVIASKALDAITLALGGDHTSSNGFRIGASEYFWEIGRENPDGSITGTVYHSFGGLAHPKGGFRISGDGVVIRFPRSTAAQRREASIKGYTESVRIHGRAGIDYHARHPSHPAHSLATSSFLVV